MGSTSPVAPVQGASRFGVMSEVLVSPAHVPPSPPQKHRRSRSRSRGIRLFLTLALPGVLLYSLGVLIPLGLAVRYSVSDINLLNGIGDFVGIKNYVDVFADPEFWGAFGFTMILTFASVVIANGGGLALAVIQATDRAGKIELTASAPGLKTAIIALTSEK